MHASATEGTEEKYIYRRPWATEKYDSKLPATKAPELTLMIDIPHHALNT